MYQLFDMNEKVTTNQPTDSYFKEFLMLYFGLSYFFLFLFLFFVCYCDSNLQLSIVGGGKRKA